MYDSDITSPAPGNLAVTAGVGPRDGGAEAAPAPVATARARDSSSGGGGGGGRVAPSRRGSNTSSSGGYVGANGIFHPSAPPSTTSSSAPGSSPPQPPPPRQLRKKTQLDGMADAIMLALKFLPLDAAPIALIVTDGVADYPSPMEYDGLSMRLCRHDVAVSCLLVDRMGSRVVARGAGRIGAITVMTKGREGAAAAAAQRVGTGILGGREGVAGAGGQAREGKGGKGGGIKYETDRLGIDFSPHGEAYSASRKHRVPDLNGLAHLVGVTGGWFYDLETLEAELVSGGSTTAAAAAGGGKSPFPVAAGGGTRQGGAFQGTGSMWLGCGGPSPALCQVRSSCCRFLPQPPRDDGAGRAIMKVGLSLLLG